MTESVARIGHMYVLYTTNRHLNPFNTVFISLIMDLTSEQCCDVIIYIPKAVIVNQPGTRQTF